MDYLITLYYIDEYFEFWVDRTEVLQVIEQKTKELGPPIITTIEFNKEVKMLHNTTQFTTFNKIH